MEYLKEKTSLSKSGVSLLSLTNVSKTFGFKTTTGIFSFENLINTANLPWFPSFFIYATEISCAGKKLQDSILKVTLSIILLSD